MQRPRISRQTNSEASHSRQGCWQDVLVSNQSQDTSRTKSTGYCDRDREHTGCRTPVRCCTESYVARTSAQVDTTPPPVEATEPHPTAEDQAQADVESEAADNASGGVVRLANQRTYLARKQPIEPPVKPDRFALPDNLPGANVPPLQLPKFDSTQKPAERKSMIEALFSDLQPLSEPVGSAAIVADQAMSLAQLQDLALQQSPVIRQAAAEVERVRGEAIQAGLCPILWLDMKAIRHRYARTAGYNGVFFNQEIVTAGKLSYAQSRQLMEMRAREHELMRARIELASNVRRGYFNVLVAQEQLKFSRAVLQLSEEVYRAQIQLVTAGKRRRMSRYSCECLQCRRVTKWSVHRIRSMRRGADWLPRWAIRRCPVISWKDH